jgi:hypothetical protein
VKEKMCHSVAHNLGNVNRTRRTIFTRKPKHPLQLAENERIIPLEIAALFFLKVKRWRCFCGASLEGLALCGYDHSDGWKVPGIEKRQWLWLHCVNCGYDFAIWKLGVPRSYTPSLPEHVKLR